MDNDSLASARLGEGMIRAGSIQPLSGLVKAFGLDEAALLRAVGLPRGALARADNVLPLDRSARLIELCAQRSGRPDLALLIGQRIEPEQYGLIGAQMTLGGKRRYWESEVRARVAQLRALAAQAVALVAVLAMSKGGLDWQGHPLRKDYPLGYEEPQFTFNFNEIDLRKPHGQNRAGN